MGVSCPLTGYVVWGKGIVKCLLAQLTEQMSGVSWDLRAGGSSLRKSDQGS